MFAKGVTLASLFLMSIAATAQDSRPQQPLLTVTGRAQTMADPDEATVRIGVMQQGANAGEAQNKVNTIMERMLAAIKGLGVDPKNIQTSNLNLYPLYAEPRPGQAPTIRGYQASNTVAVRLHDFALIGKVIDVSLTAGANEIQGIQFGLRNDLTARTTGLRAAVTEARAKADAMADALGMRIVSVHEVMESEGVIMPPPFARGGADMMMAKAETQVEPGQLTITSSVTVRYVIAPK